MVLRDSLRRAVPEAVKPLFRSVAAAFDPLPRALHRLRGGDAVPPWRVRASVGQPSISRYVAEGALVADEIERLLAAYGTPLREFNAICDLASGPGKVLCELQPASWARIAALDVNGAAIEWLRATRPDVDAQVNSPRPPTAFEPGAFDLILSI